MISTQLFDKIIDVEFTINQSPGTGGIFFEQLSFFATEPMPKPGSTQSISFRTPRMGPKPNIQLSMEALPNQNVSHIVLKITNFFSGINIALYKYMKIRAGYNNGPVVILDCEILNCYVERPNPEGITVFEGVVGSISDLLTVSKVIAFDIDNDKIGVAINKIALASGLVPNISLPKEWEGETIPLKTNYSFTNALTMRTWLTDMLNTIASSNGLSKLYIGVKSGLLKVYGIGSDGEESPTVIIDKVSTAYLMGGYIIIKAPWNPMILPDTIFKMDTRFFRGRMGSLQVGGEKKDFSIFRMNISFSTQDQNEMEIEAIDLSTVGD